MLMLLDCRPSMFIPNKGVSPMDSALQACERLLRLKVQNVAVGKTGKRDGVAVMLYNLSQQQSTHMLLPLERPGVKQIKEIRQYTEGKSSLNEEYCTCDDGDTHKTDATLCPLRTALYEANKAFVQAEYESFAL